MKKVSYDDILDIDKIFETYYRIKINSKHKQKCINFDLNKGNNIIDIYKTLESRNYHHGLYNIFIIRIPKERVILSEGLKDKVVNHLVSNYLLKPLIIPKLINSNIATRENMGTSYGIKLLKKYFNKLKFYNKEIYILKCDIKKYFFNIDHNILISKLCKIIKDKDILNIVNTLIESTNRSYINDCIKSMGLDLPIYKNKKGLPIGNMSSQLLAIFYLNDLDHYIKEKLKIKYYLRYMDDFILIHNDKTYLNYCLKEIDKLLKGLKLSLNNKTEIINFKHGFNFLGYRFKLINQKLIIKVISKNRYRIKRKLYILKEKDYLKYVKSKSSYKGYFLIDNSNKSKWLTIVDR